MKRKVYFLVFLMTPFLVMAQNNVKSQPDIQHQIDQLNSSLQGMKSQLNELKRTTQAQFQKMESYAKKTEGWDSIHQQYDVWFTNTGAWINYLEMRDKAVRESLKKRKQFATYAAVGAIAGALIILLLAWWLFGKKLGKLREEMGQLAAEMEGKIKKAEEGGLALEKRLTEAVGQVERRQDTFKSEMMSQLGVMRQESRETYEGLQADAATKLTEMHGSVQQEIQTLQKDLKVHHHDLFEKEIASLKSRLDQLTPKKQ